MNRPQYIKMKSSGANYYMFKAQLEKAADESGFLKMMNDMMTESRNAADAIKGAGETSDRKRANVVSSIQDKWRPKLETLLSGLPNKLASKLRGNMEERMGMFIRAYL